MFCVHLLPASAVAWGAPQALQCQLMRIACKPFDFEHLVLSHGWAFLAPFEWDEEKRVLRRRFLVEGHSVDVEFSYRLCGGQAEVCCDNGSRLSPGARTALRAAARRMFWLDFDFSDLWGMCRGDAELGYVSRRRCGGMLRSPTVFEDIIKTVCTTNCDWRNTKRMCEGLCSLQGGAFPDPTTVLQVSTEALRSQTSMGYRVRTVRTVASQLVEGKMPIDEWARARDFQRIRACLRQIWGIGDYCVNHILVLLGDFSQIPVDSEVLHYLRQSHFKGAPVDENAAVQPYREFGQYQYIAYKFGRIARRLNYVDK